MVPDVSGEVRLMSNRETKVEDNESTEEDEVRMTRGTTKTRDSQDERGWSLGRVPDTGEGPYVMGYVGMYV